MDVPVAAPDGAPLSLNRWLCELFAVVNLAFLAVDIGLAHAVNDFGHAAEYVPVVFSIIAPVALIGGLWRRNFDRGRARTVGLAVGFLSVLIGVAGMLLHLHGSFFVEQTIRNLVFTAPFAAPLSYTGLGLLLILNRLEPRGSQDHGPWVIFLALGGFLGNLALTLCDHAQNGFFVTSEWIAVWASAFAVGFLTLILLRQRDDDLLKACVGVMLAQVVVGLLGFGLHVQANLATQSSSAWDDFVFGAPAFAPLLFPNLALLALLGLYELRRATLPQEAAI